MDDYFGCFCGMHFNEATQQRKIEINIPAAWFLANSGLTSLEIVYTLHRYMLVFKTRTCFPS
jgi:hypothetical protein